MSEPNARTPAGEPGAEPPRGADPAPPTPSHPNDTAPMPGAVSPPAHGRVAAPEVTCATGTPDWLRTRFSDGFAAHEFE